MAKEIILGIDLGTTNSVVSYMQEDGNWKVIPNPEGPNTTPSVVSFKPDGEEIVGFAAKRQLLTNPDTVASIKRIMGTDKKVHIKCLNKDFTPQEISAKILAYMKKYAEDNLGEKISKAVITVPAYFNDAQRQATKDAGQIAGLEVVRIIKVPTAAAHAYGDQVKTDKDQKIIVYDLGGGTFDVSILDIADGTFEVVSTSGDNNLGGDDWDNRLADFLKMQIKAKHNVDITNDKMACQRLKEEAEKAKIALSSLQNVTVSLPFIAMTSMGPVNFEMDITRAKFEELTRDLLRRTEAPVQRALSDAGLNPSQLDEVILIGGSTRMPAVVETVKRLTGKTPNISINPDEAVSIGATIQGGVIRGDKKDVLLLDVTPLTLGIETMGGVLTPLIQRNTTIPTTKSQVFSTAEDNQPSVDIVVFQGERPMARDNKLLGQFRLDGIRPARRGQPRIEVTFSIDVNGIVSVKAKDLDTNKEQQITISGTNGLSKDEIDRMMKEAEENREADEKRKEEIEVKNKAESLISQIDEALTNEGDKMDASQKEQTQKLRDELKAALDANDIATLKEKMSQLEQAAAYAQQYQNQQGAYQGQSSQNNTNNDDDIIDADFTDKAN